MKISIKDLKKLINESITTPSRGIELSRKFVVDISDINSSIEKYRQACGGVKNVRTITRILAHKYRFHGPYFNMILTRLASSESGFQFENIVFKTLRYMLSSEFLSSEFYELEDDFVKYKSIEYDLNDQKQIKKLEKTIQHDIKPIQDVFKFLTPKAMTLAKKIPKGEKPKEVFGQYAFAQNRTGKSKPVPAEKDTAPEKRALQALDRHFDDNVPIKNATADQLKTLLKRGKYSDVIKEPSVKKIYRGIILNKLMLKKILKVKELPKEKGSMKVSGTLKPRKGRSSSWSSSKKKAQDFTTRYRPGWYAVILIADVSDNKNKLLSGPDGLYKIDVAAGYDEEKEIVALGPVKISGVEWQLKKESRFI